MSENVWYYMGRPFDELSDNEVAMMLWRAHKDFEDNMSSVRADKTFVHVAEYAIDRLGRDRARAIVLDDLRPVTLRPSWRARLWRSIVEYVAAWRAR